MKNENELYQYLENLKNRPLRWMGKTFRVLEFGQRNFEEGPDFCRALLKIGGDTCRGAIELHLKAKDWYRHYHHVNPLYKDVLLHLVWSNDLPVQSVFDHEGKSIPTIAIENMRIRQKRLLSWECPHRSKVFSHRDLEKLGRFRIENRQKKFDKMIDQYGWEETVHRQLFRNLMYRKNIHLPVLVNWEEMKKYGRERSIAEREYTVFYRYGFMPPDSKTDDYSRRYLQFVHNQSYPGERQKAPLYGCRPYNFPLRRIAGLLALYEYFGYDIYGTLYHLWKQNKAVMTVSRINNTLFNDMNQHSDSYWNFHSSWGKTLSRQIALIGKQRWKNIVYNTLLPLLYLRALTLNHQQFAQMITEWLHNMPLIEGNYQERFISGHINLKPQNACQQYGLLLMYSSCFADDSKHCDQCLKMLS